MLSMNPGKGILRCPRHNLRMLIAKRRRAKEERRIYTSNLNCWRAWKEAPGGEYRVRTGDRYLGGKVWEHYLGFEQRPGLDKSIKLFMIRLGNEDVQEDVIIRPGSRYAILKVTNGTMTAHKGLWTWSVQ